MTLTLYGSLQSTCTKRVLLVLRELGVTDYRLSNIDMQKGEHQEPNYVQDFHPVGRIPVLDDDGTRLFESRAICQYLVTKYGSGGALDKETQTLPELATYEQAASVEYSYFDPSMKSLAYENIFKKFMGHGDPDTAAVEKLKALLIKTLQHYETILSNREYLASNVSDLRLLRWEP
ncbi:glutathione S-transferase [Fusarium albosuccineum]|uniref:glutathione transferase n=1 Tax=Fusarium albosuccineum TaxID=1237068 RepID=A0A8H4L776_9HYPO|nr:glutathione S-transferase [Fusarium albosuccineum]